MICYENDTDANLIDDLLAPQKMESTGGADGIRGLSRETGISQESIQKVYGDVSSEDIKLLGDKLNKNNVETLFSKGDRGGTGSELVQNVTKIVKTFAKDADAIADVERTLSANKPNKKGVIDITDSQLEEAFSNNIKFLEDYKNKVSGAFSYTFGRASSKTLDANQAIGEINTAKDLLDGKALLKSDGSGQSFLTEIDNVTALSDLRTSGGNVKTPDYSLTEINGATRLVEVKTPFKKMLPKRIRTSLKGAVEQIVEYNTLSNPTDKGIIRLDYRSSTAPSDLSISTIEKTVKERLNVVIDTTTNTKGSDFVDFVEVVYEDSSQLNSIQTLVIKVN